MRIIIAGAGEVGFHLANLLAREKHDLVMIDSDKDVLKYANSQLDIVTVRGNSTSPTILKQAGISIADLLIAVTSNQDTNIATCILGKRLGAGKTIARVSDSEIFHLKEELRLSEVGIDDIVSPPSLAAAEIRRLLKKTALTDSFDFEEGALSLIGITIGEESELKGQQLSETAYLNPDNNFTTVAILREKETIIPHGDDTFMVNDHAYFIAQPDAIQRVTDLAGKVDHDIENIMILGASEVGVHTARLLQNSYKIKMIEPDKNRCMELVEELSEVMLLNGDSRDIELLKSEGLENMDAFLALTGNAAGNIMSCLVAKNLGVQKTIALVENLDYIHLSQRVGVDTLINKKLIAASFIFRHIRRGDIIDITSVHGVDAEVLEFEISSASKIIGRPLKEIDFPKLSIVGGVIREGKGIAVRGDFEFLEGDKAVILTRNDCVKEIESLFN